MLRATMVGTSPVNIFSISIFYIVEKTFQTSLSCQRDVQSDTPKRDVMIDVCACAGVNSRAKSRQSKGNIKYLAVTVFIYLPATARTSSAAAVYYWIKKFN